MDNQFDIEQLFDTEVIEALSVSFAQATPYQRELQGRFHNTNAIVSTLQEFLSDDEVMPNLGTLAFATWIYRDGLQDEGLIHLMRLGHLDDDDELVCFRSHTDGSQNYYGLLASDTGVVTVLPFEQFFSRVSIDAMRAAARTIRQVSDEVRMTIHDLRVRFERNDT